MESDHVSGRVCYCADCNRGEYIRMHTNLGCDGCEYCDPEALWVRSCCLFRKRIEFDPVEPIGEQCKTRIAPDFEV